MSDRVVDFNRLAYSGKALPPEAQARWAQRWGWLAYAEYTWASMRAYLRTILIASVGNPLLYLAAMGVGLGALVARGAGTMGGVPYLVFVAPGLLISTIVMEATGEFSFPVMAGFKWVKFYHAAVASPVEPWQIVVGQVFAVACRFLVQGTAFWLFVLAFGATRSPWAPLMVPIAVVSALAFGVPLMAYAATLEDEGFQFSFIQRFVVMPMYLFAGTFYPLESMPGYLQWIGWISPMWHGTQLARVASYGLPLPAWQVAGHLAFLIGVLVMGLLWAGRNFRRRLSR